MGPAGGALSPDAPRCYTTALWSNGRARFDLRHARRLVRDVQATGLGSLEIGACLDLFGELGRSAFGPATGIVRLDAWREGGALRLAGTTRPVGDSPSAWSAIVAHIAHPGLGPWPGAKLANHPEVAAARDAARAAGADDALLLDRAGRLVECARTCPFVVLQGGSLVTPPLSRGGVASVAREILLTRVPEIAERDVSRAELATLRELVLANAVRGAVAVVRLDGAPIGGGAPGPVALRLAAALDAED